MDYFEIQTRKIVERALEEDLGWGDVTTDNLIPDDVDAEGSIVSRRGGIVCGVGVVKMVFSVDPDLELQVMLEDGESMRLRMSSLWSREGSQHTQGRTRSAQFLAEDERYRHGDGAMLRQCAACRSVSPTLARPPRGCES